MSVCSETILLPAGGKAPAVSPTPARPPVLCAARCPAEELCLLLALPRIVPCLLPALPAACPACSLPCLPAGLPAPCPTRTAPQPGAGRAEPEPVCATYPSPGKSQTRRPTPSRHLQRTHACRIWAAAPVRCARLRSPQPGRDAPGAGTRIFRARLAPRNATHPPTPFTPRGEKQSVAVGCQQAGPAVGAATGAAPVIRARRAVPTPGKATRGLRRGRPDPHRHPRARPSRARASALEGAAGPELFLLEKRIN